MTKTNSHHIITLLRGAWLEAGPPTQAFERARKTARGLKRRGLTYEEKVGKYLRRLETGELHSHQWFSFQDLVGKGWAQTDHYLVLPKAILLVECKLTQSDSAFLQMAQLYVPLLTHLYKRPVMTLQACQNLRYSPKERRSPEELILRTEFGNFTWHYLGI